MTPEEPWPGTHTKALRLLRLRAHRVRVHHVVTVRRERAVPLGEQPRELRLQRVALRGLRSQKQGSGGRLPCL